MTVLKSSQVVVTRDGSVALTPAMREALDEAYQRGVEQGRQEAGIATADALGGLAGALEQVATRHVEAVDTGVKLDAETIVALAADLATWFVEAAMRAEPRLFVQAAEAVMANTLGTATVEVAVHPSLVDAVSGVAPANVGVRGDASLGPADYRVVVGDMHVDRIWADAIGDVGPSIAASLEVEG